MALDILVGLQWGDEGKGKIVDLLASEYNIVARFQGGPNAGHTLVIGDQKFVLHTIPSGIIHPNTLNIIGAGTVIDPNVLLAEISQLEKASIDVKPRLTISDKAHIIMPTHKLLDKYYELAKGDSKIGSTLRGIGPAYQDKYARTGLRMEHIHKANFNQLYSDLKAFHLTILSSLGYTPDTELDVIENEWMESIEELRSLKCAAIEDDINSALDSDASVLAEGAQGTLLDIAFGSYPFVTSSSTLSASACIGLGVAPQRVSRVIGIYKAYLTRVGSGPFPTELTGDTGHTLMTAGNEYGATTGRERRCGWLDLNLLQKTIKQNGVTDLVMTKIDVLNCLSSFQAMNLDGQFQSFPSWKENLSDAKDFNSLTSNARAYIKHVEDQVGIRHSLISTGPKRSQILQR